MKKNSLIIVWVVSLLWCMSMSPGELAAADEIPLIGADELKQELNHGAPMVLANALSPIEFKDLTIKGSVSIPSSRVSGNEFLPKDKDMLLVFFCKGPPG